MEWHLCAGNATWRQRNRTKTLDAGETVRAAGNHFRRVVRHAKSLRVLFAHARPLAWCAAASAVMCVESRPGYHLNISQIHQRKGNAWPTPRDALESVMPRQMPYSAPALQHLRGWHRPANGRFCCAIVYSKTSMFRMLGIMAW